MKKHFLYCTKRHMTGKASLRAKVASNDGSDKNCSDFSEELSSSLLPPCWFLKRILRVTVPLYRLAKASEKQNRKRAEEVGFIRETSQLAYSWWTSLVNGTRCSRGTPAVTGLRLDGIAHLAGDTPCSFKPDLRCHTCILILRWSQFSILSYLHHISWSQRWSLSRRKIVACRTMKSVSLKIDPYYRKNLCRRPGNNERLQQ